jgi:hypothetical protein
MLGLDKNTPVKTQFFEFVRRYAVPRARSSGRPFLQVVRALSPGLRPACRPRKGFVRARKRMSELERKVGPHRHLSGPPARLEPHVGVIE